MRLWLLAYGSLPADGSGRRLSWFGQRVAWAAESYVAGGALIAIARLPWLVIRPAQIVVG